MNSTPRIIATTASVALLAAGGAGGAALVLSQTSSSPSQSELEAASPITLPSQKTLPSPTEDRTTVYRAPQDDDDDDESGQIQPAPRNTGFNGTGEKQKPGNTSKQS